MNREFGIAVKGISSECMDDDLYDAFGPFGSIQEVFIKAERGYAFVTFEAQESVAKAVAGAPAEVAGTAIRVEARTPARALVPAPASANIYINGLSEFATAEQVQQAVASFGLVDLEAIQVRADRGIAFVSFETEDAASAAVACSTIEVGGQTASVDFRRSAVRSGGRRRAKGRKPKAIPANSIYLKGLPLDCDEDVIEDALAGFGTVRSVEKRVARDFAFATFEDAAAAEAAIAHQGLNIAGAEIIVELRTGPKNKPQEEKEA